MQIEEEEMTLDRHVQLPERIPRGPSEKRLQREQPISAHPRRLGGGRFGVDAACAVGVTMQSVIILLSRVDLRAENLLDFSIVVSVSLDASDSGRFGEPGYRLAH